MPTHRHIFCFLLAIAGLSFASARSEPAVTTQPRYDAAGRLAFPSDYRDWTYLTSGFDMSYVPMPMAMDHTFDNVFVNGGAYRSFLRTGTWPDKTMLVLEHRTGREKGSINRAGAFQTGVTDVEVHVKDEARFPGRWAFFAFGPRDASGTLLPRSAACYQCHSSHAAVDTTFVQFYPTLLPVAAAKHTLSAGYRHDSRASAAPAPTAT